MGEMGRRQFLLVRALGLACLAFLLAAGLAGAASLPLDLDRDGLSSWRERGLGTSALEADTDKDGLSDGWEASRGLSPVASDTDADGVADDAEVRFASDPTRSDTDGDGLSDLAESTGDGGPDCDGDGARAVREVDNDADGRPDAAEDAAHRCDADVDDDGLLDGSEANPACVALPDCDGDGVADADESPAGFDPLDPDTFDVHLPDGVSYAFAKSGQGPSGDGDADGIPDSWENQTGLIDWGPFEPRADQRDLFVEFVRVLGPDSGRFSDLSMHSAYDLVADAFDAQGYRLQYVETIVRFTDAEGEPVAASNPSRTTNHYRTVLDRSRYATNPYVLTVVLNPQHDQSQLIHAGVAPLRGMLAAVDVSQFVEFTWRDAEGNYTIRNVSPFLESLIAGGRITQASQAGALPNGKYYTFVSGREIQWTPYWLKGPQIQHTDGRWIPLSVIERFVDEAPLAHTLLHEIGHTLGLCHTHEATCNAQLPSDERVRAAESSMSYTSPDGLVAFLPSEWERVGAYLACPPPTPVRLVAEGASLDERLDAKYAYEFDPDPATAGRNCEDYAPLEHVFDPAPVAFRYDPPAERAAPAPAQENAWPAIVYWSGAAGLGAFAALSVGRWRLNVDLPRAGRFPKE